MAVSENFKSQNFIFQRFAKTIFFFFQDTDGGENVEEFRKIFLPFYLDFLHRLF